MKNTLACRLLWGKNKKGESQLYQGEGVGKVSRLERKAPISSGERDFAQGDGTSYPYIAMSCFELPVGLCKDIEIQIRKFWWGGRGGQRKIHWKSWEVLCKLKEGGMGFKDLVRFNEAMLAKQIWRLQTDKKILFCLRFSAQNIFLQVRCLRQKARRAPLHGKVFLKQGMSLRKGCYGGLVMGHRFGYSRIVGFLAVFQPRQYHSRRIV